MPRRKKAHEPSDTLRALQEIAKKDPHSLKPPTSGITSSSEALRDRLDRFFLECAARAREIADNFGVQAQDVLRDLARRIR